MKDQKDEKAQPTFDELLRKAIKKNLDGAYSGGQPEADEEKITYYVEFCVDHLVHQVMGKSY